ncbi:hypothetical protein B0H13DRAFT_2525895 [Mycena leptocephala]|nr:hypothetical protein B0H13DRAFT_2525895 [Mycena leptocephala]
MLKHKLHLPLARGHLHSNVQTNTLCHNRTVSFFNRALSKAMKIEWAPKGLIWGKIIKRFIKRQVPEIQYEPGLFVTGFVADLIPRKISYQPFKTASTSILHPSPSSMSAALVESVKAWFSTVSVVFAACPYALFTFNLFEATFLAAVQSQIIALSYQDNSTHLKTATNVLGFAGVLLDVTSACLGLMTSTVLQRHIAVVEKQLDAIEDASPEQLQETLRFLEASRTRGQLLASLLSSSAFPDLLRRILAKVMARAAVLEKQNTDGDGGELNPLTESTGFRIEAVPNR